MNRRTLAAAGSGALLVAVAAAVWLGRPATPDAEPAAVTVPVQRTTLTSELRLSGRLGHGPLTPVGDTTGTVTGLPRVGDVVRVGARVYEVDGRPVVLLRGKRPFWRELSTGSATGPDVRQLEQNLADLGFGGGFDVDERFTPATARAVRAWQRSIGAEPTGRVRPGDVVTVDAGDIRIARVDARLGGVDAAAPVSYTATAVRVTATLTPAQARELAAGTAVEVVLPDGTRVASTIAAIDPGGEPTGTDGETTPATATVDLPDQKAVADIGLPAVQVRVAKAERARALVVPVTALLATADGGYAVEVVRDGVVERIPVEVGLVADARAEVSTAASGDGPEPLREGDAVVIAS
ncbi:peptidoglycan-binding protein [Polymorphospora rubra]|uniref:Peptidoglycan-binding protein n=1 Tax=Polymorphospora rubra TaxID=338584 RepID=A0A810MUX2_9ACTN|nr:peptidoglycan-binding protein [Polymorphospora rubra]BCJ64931.1 peptidoglycan-binding protein [Polymorphospora rubra]